MSGPRKLRVGGVPEHFNAPIHIAQKDGKFVAAGIELQWKEFPGGTGAMTAALTAGEIDMAILLTEGLVTNSLKSQQPTPCTSDGCTIGSPTENQNKIVGTYVRSPLVWGIHTLSNHKDIQTLEDVKDKTYGVSRMGSGSHLMACVDRLLRGWESLSEGCKFSPVVVGDLNGAKEAMAKGKIDVFMWEKFTTKSLIVSGEWKKVGERQTPWGCFVLACNTKFIDSELRDSHVKLVKDFMEVTKDSCDNFKSEAQRENTLKYISENYSLDLKDSEEWLDGVEWACEPTVSSKAVFDVISYLTQAGVLDAGAEYNPTSVCHKSCQMVAHFSDTMYDWRVKGLYNALASVGKMIGPLTMQDLMHLGHLDQYHYLGLEAVDHMMECLGLTDNGQTVPGVSDRHVLDIGSGIGGPARYVCSKTACKVTCVDIQAELTKASHDLNERIGMADKIKTITCDCTSFDLGTDVFDHAISLLVILHIPQRTKLFTNMYKCMKPGSTFLIEDMVLIGQITAEQKSILTDLVGAPQVPDKQTYEADLRLCGFEDLDFFDLTKLWCDWTSSRYESLMNNKTEICEMHGVGIFEKRRVFYLGISQLFSSGAMGGFRITGTKSGGDAKYRQTLIRNRTRMALKQSQGAFTTSTDIV